MNYKLYCDDCLNIPYISFNKPLALVITDAPHKNILSSDNVVIRLENYLADTMVVCKDEIIAVNSSTRFIQRDHRAFGGNLFEKMKFAAYYIEHYTQPGDLVLDPFCGYSSTGLAALGLKRSYIGIDNKPEAIQESERILNGCS